LVRSRQRSHDSSICVAAARDAQDGPPPQGINLAIVVLYVTNFGVLPPDV